MTDVPTQVILAVFKTENGADDALTQLKSAEKQHLIDIDNVAVLKCDTEGKVRIKEPTDIGRRRGAVVRTRIAADRCVRRQRAALLGQGRNRFHDA